MCRNSDPFSQFTTEPCLHRIVCETGTLPLAGDYPHVDGIWVVDSIGLIRAGAGRRYPGNGT